MFNILMENLSESEQRSINKYLEIVRYETVADAERMKQNYPELFSMIGQSIDSSSVFVHRNYTMFNVNVWAPEKAGRFQQILVNFIDREMEKADPAKRMAKETPDVSQAIKMDGAVRVPPAPKPDEEKKDADQQ